LLTIALVVVAGYIRFQGIEVGRGFSYFTSKGGVKQPVVGKLVEVGFDHNGHLESIWSVGDGDAAKVGYSIGRPVVAPQGKIEAFVAWGDMITCSDKLMPCGSRCSLDDASYCVKEIKTPTDDCEDRVSCLKIGRMDALKASLQGLMSLVVDTPYGSLESGRTTSLEMLSEGVVYVPLSIKEVWALANGSTIVPVWTRGYSPEDYAACDNSVNTCAEAIQDRTLGPGGSICLPDVCVSPFSGTYDFG
jgi:hypothetical protein